MALFKSRLPNLSCDAVCQVWCVLDHCLNVFLQNKFQSTRCRSEHLMNNRFINDSVFSFILCYFISFELIVKTEKYREASVNPCFMINEKVKKRDGHINRWIDAQN